MRTFREDVTCERELRPYIWPGSLDVFGIVIMVCFSIFVWYQVLTLPSASLLNYAGAITVLSWTVFFCVRTPGMFLEYSLYCAYNAAGGLVKTSVMRRKSDVNDVAWSFANIVIEFPLNGSQYEVYQRAATGLWEEASRHFDVRVCLDLGRLRRLEASYPIGVPGIVKLEARNFQPGPSMGCVYLSLQSMPWLRSYLAEHPESAKRLFYNDFTVWVTTLVAFAGSGRSAFELIADVIDQLADTSRLGKSKEGMRLREELTQRALEIVPIEYGELHARLTAQQRKISEHQSTGQN